MDGEKRETTKRELRQQKREIKRAGNQRRRRMVKQVLREKENPEDVPPSEFDFGRFRSAPMNGMDRDKTRRKTPPSQGKA